MKATEWPEEMEVFPMNATEWLEEWLKRFPDDRTLVEEARKRGESDEDIKYFLEGT